MAERRDVKRTKATIYQSYMDLLFLKHKRKITVRDILERSNFSHGTFYAHFRDIEDLENQVRTLIIEDCRRSIDQSTEVQAEPLLAALEPRQSDLRALHQSGNLLWIADEMKQIMISAMVQSAVGQRTPESVTLYTCIFSTLVDATLDWLVRDDRPDRETFLKTLTAFLSGGINAIAG